MAIFDTVPLSPFVPPVELLIFAASAAIFYLVFVRRPHFRSNAPKVASNNWPIVGSLQFWTARLDFWRKHLKETTTGNFSYHLGKHPVVGVSSKEGRDAFFFSRDLSVAEGYAVLFGQSPRIKDFEVVDGTRVDAARAETFDSFNTYFTKRIVAMLKADRLGKAIPTLVSDVRSCLDELGESGLMDPFDNLFELVYKLTQRTVGANEIANSRPLLDRTLRLFQLIEKTSTSYQIIFPWLPSPAMFKRVWGGSQLYFIFSRIANTRQKEGRRENDGMQLLLDHGDDMTRIIGFVVGALFAGQLNTGISVAATVCYLAANPKWISELRREVAAAAEKFTPGDSSPLPERLAKIPLAGWENELPTIELCARETMRLNMPGTAFRKNVSDKPVKINEKEEIPPQTFGEFSIWLCCVRRLLEISNVSPGRPSPQSRCLHRPVHMGSCTISRPRRRG